MTSELPFTSDWKWNKWNSLIKGWIREEMKKLQDQQVNERMDKFVDGWNEGMNEWRVECMKKKLRNLEINEWKDEQVKRWRNEGVNV